MTESRIETCAIQSDAWIKSGIAYSAFMGNVTETNTDVSGGDWYKRSGNGIIGA